MIDGSAIAEARPRVVAALAARFRDLDLAEDAFAAATERLLALDEPVANMGGWLWQASRRKALGMLRQAERERRKAGEAAMTMAKADILHLPDPIPDERLRLLFVCCHPALSAEARVALALKVVCGLPVETIARAFAVPAPTMYQRITRAKAKVREAGISFELPERRDWQGRIASVLGALEVGYWTAYSDSAAAPADDFASDTARLADMLAELLPEEPEVLGFAALLALAGSRRAARVDAGGAMVPLSQQDTSLWDRQAIERGRALLDRAIPFGKPGPYQVMATIHLAHAMRAFRREVDWPAIRAAYDALALMRPGPLVAVNRAVALAEVEGPAAGLAALDEIDTSRLANHRPLHAARVALLERDGRLRESCKACRKALACTPPPAEKRFFEQCLYRLEKALVE